MMSFFLTSGSNGLLSRQFLSQNPLPMFNTGTLPPALKGQTKHWPPTYSTSVNSIAGSSSDLGSA